MPATTTGRSRLGLCLPLRYCGGGGALSAAMLAAYVATAALAFPAGADLDLDGGGGGGPPAFAVAADGGGGGIPAIALQSETS